MLHRLRAAGCSVDLEHIEMPVYPLRVISHACGLETNLFPGADETGIVFYLRIVASASFMICSVRLQANWLPQPVCWVEYCKQHRGHYCLQQGTGVHFSFAAADILNRRTLHAGVLKRGSYLRGFLAGMTTGVQPSLLGEKLEATLWIEDVFGTEHPYTISINNRPSSRQITRQQDSKETAST